MVSADRTVEIAQGVSAMYAAARKHGLVMEAVENGDEQWYTVYAKDAGNLLDVCDAAESLVAAEPDDHAMREAWLDAQADALYNQGQEEGIDND